VHLTTPSSFMIFEVDVDGLSCTLVGAVLVLLAMANGYWDSRG
jgi:hypothetical protein